MALRRARFEPKTGRAIFMPAKAMFDFFSPPDIAPDFEKVGTTAVVTIRGPLIQHEDPWAFWDSYDAIGKRTAAAAASDCTDVALKIDSPGGDALGCFECAREMRKACEAAGKRLWAYCDGTIASAGFALACAASSGIYTPKAGMLGSIGVLQGMVDTTARDAANGVKYIFAASGAHKLYGNPHVPASKEAFEHMQASCEELAQLFFEFIGEMRPQLTLETLRTLDADCMYGAKAVAAGLADGVEEWTDFLAMVAKGDSGRALGAQGTEKPMATKMSKEVRAFLAEQAKGDSDEAAMARGLLAANPEEEGGDKEKGGEGGGEGGDKEKEAKAKVEAEEKAKKAAEEEKEMKAKQAADDEAKAKALAATNPGEAALQIAERALARANELDAQLKSERVEAEITRLLASRPDFAAEVVKDLRAMGLESVKRAVANWPRAKGYPAAAAGIQGTPGKTQTGNAEDVPAGTDEENAHIARAMGGQTRAPGVQHKGSAMTLGYMTPQEAAKRRDELAAGKAVS